MRVFRELLRHEETNPTDICLHPVIDLKIREITNTPNEGLLIACRAALKHIEKPAPSDLTWHDKEAIKQLRQAIIDSGQKP